MSFANRVIAELRGDKAIWMIVILLGLFSLLVVYSSTGTIAWREKEGNTTAYLIRQILIILSGWFLTYLAYLMNYRRYSQIAPAFLLTCIGLLAMTLLIGKNINGAKRWLEIPIIHFSFQTSDLAKLALVIYVARVIAAKQEMIKEFSGAFVPIILPIVIVCGLIAPADLSTAIILFAVCFAMMFIGRIELKYLFWLVLAGAGMMAIIILIGIYFPTSGVRVETWIARIRDFMGNADGEYQTVQAKIAMARGNFFGLGPGHSLQRNYLPSPYSDYIFATICEEYGLFGVFLVMGLYILLFFRVVGLVTKSAKTFGAMLAMGACLLIVIQALTNMAIAVHLVPVGGITLPLLSMGGTSFWFMSIALGMILSVSKQVEREQYEGE
jgi:cell division protein FtsW